jgi:hypothetical protein
MCYVVFLSTSDPGDLTAHNTGLLRFSRELGREPAVELLEHPFRWHVGSRQGCGCGFRHLTAPELGFNTPEEWFPEEPEDLHATAEFFAVVQSLIAAGHKVDCVDVWTQTGCDLVRRMEVATSTLRDGEFRLFENHHFRFAE